jgi:hypothetical protein
MCGLHADHHFHDPLTVPGGSLVVVRGFHQRQLLRACATRSLTKLSFAITGAAKTKG